MDAVGVTGKPNDYGAMIEVRGAFPFQTTVTFTLPTGGVDNMKPLRWLLRPRFTPNLELDLQLCFGKYPWAPDCCIPTRHSQEPHLPLYRDVFNCPPNWRRNVVVLLRLAMILVLMMVTFEMTFPTGIVRCCPHGALFIPNVRRPVFKQIGKPHSVSINWWWWLMTWWGLVMVVVLGWTDTAEEMIGFTTQPWDGGQWWNLELATSEQQRDGNWGQQVASQLIASNCMG